MPVHSLELENFKSYGGVQRIGPFTNFTCVIGPNGSGKSNLMDAISFVLGVQSKALRSQQLQDLIYRQPGTEQLKKKPFGASVTLLYRVTPEEELSARQHHYNDPEDDDEGDSPSGRRRGRRSAARKSRSQDDDEDDDVEEEGRLIRFGRSISPSGVGEYHVDGKRVTWTAYEKALSKLGVLVQARNFLVFQGDVEALARKTPAQLVQLVDVLSGSAAFQKDYDKAFAEHQERHKTTMLQWKTQKGLRHERKLLKQQKNEAERFQELQEDKREAQTEFYLWQLYQIQQDVEQRQEELEDAQGTVGDLKDKQAQAVEKVQAAKKELSTVRRQLTQRQDDDITRITGVLDSKEPALAAVKAEQADLEKKLTADNKALAKARSKAASHEQDVENLDQDLEKSKADLAVLEEEYDRIKEAATRVKWTTAQEEEYEQVKRQAKAASAHHVTKVQQQTQKLASANRNADTIRSNIEDAKKQLALEQDQAKQNGESHGKLTKTLAQVKEDIKTTETRLVDVQKKHRATSRRKQELDTSLEEIQAQLRDAKAVMRKNRDEERLVETVKNLKTFTSKGVYGRLADLCRPSHKRYNMAVTVAAGKDMDAIVVDTPQTAQTCIQYLREQRIGTATFLPLSQLQVPSHESTQHLRAIVEQDERYRLAVDIIDVSEDYSDVDLKKAVQYAVANTVVSDDMEAARELCYRKNQRIKAVTLQGAVISKAGTMTGGTTRDDKSKSRWKNVELEKMQAKYEELSQERSELDREETSPQDEIQELNNKLGTLQNKENFMTIDRNGRKSREKQLATSISNLKKQIQKLEREQAKSAKTVQEIEEELKEAQEAVRSTEEEHFKPFRERTGLTDLEAYDKSMGKSREEFLENKRVLEDHMATLKQKKEYEVARDVQKPITRIEQRIKERETALEAALAKQEKLEEEIKAAQDELEQAKEAVGKLEAEASEIEERVKEAQTGLDGAKSAAKKAAHAVSRQETALERLRSKLHETLQKARVEEVELPMKGDEDSEEESEEEEEGKGRRRTRRQRKSKGKRKTVESDDEEEKSESEQASSQLSSRETHPFTQDSRSRTHFSQAENAVVIRDREKAAMVDYSSLGSDLKKIKGEKDERKTRKGFEDKISKISAEIEAMTPNMKAAEAFDTCGEKLKESSADYEKAKKDTAKAEQNFEQIKVKRTELFSEAFVRIDEALKTIYRDMTKSSKHPLGGNAFLSLDDQDEPYKGGMKFNAMPPMKRFRDMEHLSGGEKTVAALSLLFAIHSFRPAPLYVMDEIDAALDNINLRKVCNYIRQRSQTDFQCIVISLKDLFYEQADALVGICRDVGTNSSQTLTLDLTQFDRNNNTTLSSGAGSPTVSQRKRRSTASFAPSSATSKKSRSSLTTTGESPQKKSKKRMAYKNDDDTEGGESSKKSRPSVTTHSEEEHSDDDGDTETSPAKRTSRRSRRSTRSVATEGDEEDTVGESSKKTRQSVATEDGDSDDESEE